jgi:hypothetical protein
MKKILLIAMLAISGMGLSAQKLDKAKDYLKSNKLAEAKTEIDGVLNDAKNQKNPEAYYTKLKIYGAIANDNALGASNPDARWTAFEALKKYVELDEKQMALILENYKPAMDIYQGFYKTGAGQYNANQQSDAFNSFKNCLAVSEYMSGKGWTNLKMDTTVVLYTGITAEKAGKKDDAAIYYAKLANAKVTGEGMGEIYKWLADYYSKKSDVPTSQKYLALGKELFPKDPFWDAYELDMLKDDKKALFAKYEELIAAHPEDYQLKYNYGVELYLAAYDTAVSKRPPNSAEMIAKVQDLMNKVTQLMPDFPNAYVVLGQIAYNRGVDINTTMKAIRPKGGVKLTPDELKKKDDLRKEAMKNFDEALPYFEKVDALLGSKGKLKMEDRKSLKDSYDIMITIYEQKNAADKVKIYEDKYNNVEKNH